MNRYDVNNFVNITYNDSGYDLEDIVSVCKRHNNSKRDYLFVNHLQGKHVPVTPSKAIKLFERLAERVEEATIGEYNKIAVIGFAETATAIGRFVALNLRNCIYRGQTTREVLENEPHLIDFEEAHSHATQQSLYGDVEKLKECDLILFVEDEITTGNTILDFIDKFSKLLPNMKYAVASILNWQSEENENKFNQLGIKTFCLVGGYINDEKATLEVDSEYKICNKAHIMDSTLIEEYSKKSKHTGFIVDRTLTENRPATVNSEDVEDMTLILRDSKRVLVLGTEEYMYAGLSVAEQIEKNFDCEVKFQATTRSPIIASEDEGYVLKNKERMVSAYSLDRETYLYNLDSYDLVLVVTDTELSNEFKFSVYSAFKDRNSNVRLAILQK